MTLYVPPTVADENYSSTSAISALTLQEKYAWQRDRAVQANPTANIVRMIESGGAPYARVEPTYTQVGGLSGLPVAVYDGTLNSYKRLHGGLYRQGDRTFVFYNVQIAIGDVIVYDADSYRVVDGSVEYNEESGRCGVLVRSVQDG